MTQQLTSADVRVVGALIEKERTTPDYYPMSLNALMNACNQTSNRDPVVSFDETIVMGSIDALRQQGLIRVNKGIDARVPKYSHRVSDVMGLNPREIAVLGVLMLRGAQTVGELRTRTARMETFEDLAEVEAVLDNLAVRELVLKLPRQAGQKEARYAHLLSGEVDVPEAGEGESGTIVRGGGGRSSGGMGERIRVLEEELEGLKRELSELRAQVVEFRAQFE